MAPAARQGLPGLGDQISLRYRKASAYHDWSCMAQERGSKGLESGRTSV